jgi:hypothetical protein
MDKAEMKRRLVEAATALLSAAKGKALQVTNLNKALFYLDLVALRDTGKTVSRSAFIALKEGPVVAKYEKHLIKPLADAGLAKQESEGLAKPVRLIAEKDDFEFLSHRMLKAAAKLGRKFSTITATQASELSHENPGWAIAYEEGLRAGKPALPIDLHIAMQQIVGLDPWLTEKPSKAEWEAIVAADEGGVEAW